MMLAMVKHSVHSSSNKEQVRQIQMRNEQRTAFVLEFDVKELGLDIGHTHFGGDVDAANFGLRVSYLSGLYDEIENERRTVQEARACRSPSLSLSYLVLPSPRIAMTRGKA